MIGQTISHYKILEKLGEGGMGVVYKAEDTKLKRTVALKFLPPGFTRDKDAKDRFFIEAQAAAALSHSNIVTVHEIDEYEDQIYITTEYIEGQNLKEKIEGGPLKIDESLKIAIQISEGLQEAHEKSIVHRDIKSANIMITEKGQVKIMDFGLAKLKGKSKLTKAGTTVGTASYMSPEQSMGKKVDHRTDIWSLGVVLYEMITGQLPFKGDYEQAVVYSILNEEPEPVTAIRTGVSTDIEKVIFKLLAKDPSSRYQHVDDLIVDLRKLKEDSKPEVSVSRKKTSPEIYFKTSRKVLTLGGIFLAVIIVVAYFLFKGKSETETPVIKPGDKPSLAVVYFENNSGDEKLDNWRSAFSELLTTDLSQSRYLKVLRSDEIYSIFKKLNLLEVTKYSSENLREIAKSGGVNHILKGSYIKAGENFVITTMLINATNGETISSLSVKAEGEKNIFPKVDELTREIKSKLKLTNDQIASDMDREVGKITTSSPEAYKYYVRGRKYHNAAEYRKSIQLTEKAVAIDPEFAMAYRSMATAYSNMGYVSKGTEYIQKAMKFSNRLSEREQYIIQGEFYKVKEKTWDKALEAYNKLLQLYPQDFMGNVSMGLLYKELEEWDKAIERYKVCIQNKEKSNYPYSNISTPYQAKGLYEKARETLEYYLQHFQDHYQIRMALAVNYTIQAEFELALSEVEKAISLVPDIPWPKLWRGNIYLFKGNFKESEKIFEKLLESEEKTARCVAIQNIGFLYQLQGRLAEAEKKFKQALKKVKEYKLKAWQYWRHFDIGYIYFLRGKYDESLKEFSQALAGSKEFDHPWGQVWSQYYISLIQLKTNSPIQIQRAEDDLLECVKQRMNKKFIRSYYLFMGKKEMKSNHFSKAIEHFNHAISYLPFQKDAVFLNPLALAYFKSGHLEKAQIVYEKITSLTYDRFVVGDIYAKAFYQLGKIYEQKGFRSKAIDNYNKFINLWKDCDPPLRPMVEDARKRVNELEGNK